MLPEEEARLSIFSHSQPYSAPCGDVTVYFHAAGLQTEHALITGPETKGSRVAEPDRTTSSDFCAHDARRMSLAAATMRSTAIAYGANKSNSSDVARDDVGAETSLCGAEHSAGKKWTMNHVTLVTKP